MSAPLTNSPIHNVPEWRKRGNSFSDESAMAKRQRLQNNYYYVLASESSNSEDEGTESVDSVQGKETDYCRDTSDTNTKSEMSDDYDMRVEYEIVSSSGSENPYANGSSSGEDALIAAGAVVATIVNESDVGIWCTDGDDETDSVSSFEFASQICKMCNIRNTVSCFPLCSHCYQIKKNCYPPRPRHKKKLKGLGIQGHQAVTADNLNACLNVLSHDSGMGSSQEMISASLTSSQQLEKLAWDKVVVPETLIQKSPEKSSGLAYAIANTSACSTLTASTSSSISQVTTSSFFTAHPDMDTWVAAASEMCIMCNASPKNGIFVHSSGGHMCCCYKCAVKYWSKSKRCPWCNLKAKNVIKGFLV